MDDIKLFAKNENEREALKHAVRILSHGIWQGKMCHTGNEKWQTTSDRWNGTTKSREDKNAPRKENIQILGHFEGWYHQTSGDERKKLSQENQKATWDNII